MSESPVVFDTSEKSFEDDVLARSEQVPVAVDFWAPWCGPCRFLGPVLERLVEGPFRDQVVLAKLNTDENPLLAGQFQIRGIPAVKIFHRRRVVTEFVGALPEDQVAAVFRSILPGPADGLVAEALALEAKGEIDTAIVRLEAAVEANRVHAGAWLALGRLRELRGESERALDAWQRVTGGGAEEAEAARLAAATRLRLEALAIGDEPQLRARLEKDSKDLEARLGIGLHLAARGDHRAALEQLLEVVRLDRNFREEAGRKAMLAVFEAAGSRSALSDEYRTRLAGVLY